MLQRLFIIVGLIVFTMTGCQDDADINIIPDDKDGTTPVKVFFSMKDYMTSTGYESMTKNSSSDLITITPLFNYIIVQDFGGSQPYIIERVGKGNIKGPAGKSYGSVAIDGTNTFDALSIEMRPGKYKIIIFTGARNVVWNSELKEGLSIPRENSTDPFPMACRYMNIDFWTFMLEKGLQEEVFYGVADFDVTKTEDLHSSPNAHNITVPLERRVSKFRVLLKDVASEDGEQKFAQGRPIALLIKADVKPIGTDQLPDGLNIWGKVWYNDAVPLTRYKYTTMTQSSPFPTFNGFNYYVSVVTATSYAPYFFSDPDTDIAISISNFECTSRDTDPPYVYYGEHNFVLKNNHITGLVLKPTNIIEPPRKVLIEPDYNEENSLINAADLFDANFEHNF